MPRQSQDAEGCAVRWSLSTPGVRGQDSGFGACGCLPHGLPTPFFRPLCQFCPFIWRKESFCAQKWSSPQSRGVGGGEERRGAGGGQ